METEEQRKLYLLSARGDSTFSKRTAGMELVAELHGRRRVDRAFLEVDLAPLTRFYCVERKIPVELTNSYDESLQKMAGPQREEDFGYFTDKEKTFVYLTDKENGELKEMATKAKAQGLRVETRTITKH